MQENAKLYVAYGSNMSLEQMEFRCPNAKVRESVEIRGYRLAFRGRYPGNGVATILPEEGGKVDAVVWSITEECEKSLDRYEGYPHLYGKENIAVHNKDGISYTAEVYIMQEPYRSHPVRPSDFYLEGILEGARENNINTAPIMEAVSRTLEEEKMAKKGKERNRFSDPIR